MADQADFKEELERITEAIHALEKMRGKLPDAQLNKSLDGYREQLRALIAKLRASQGGNSGDKESAVSQPTHMPTPSNVLGDLYQAYRSVPGNPQLNQQEFQSFLVQYLRWLNNKFTGVHLYGLDMLSAEGDKVAMSYKEAFISPPMRVLTQEQWKEIEVRAGKIADRTERARIYLRLVDERRNKGETIPLPALLNLSSNIVLNGPPGSGKTSILAHLASSLVSNILSGKLLSFVLPEGRNMLAPLLISMRGYAHYCEECAKILVPPAPKPLQELTEEDVPRHYEDDELIGAEPQPQPNKKEDTLPNPTADHPDLPDSHLTPSLMDGTLAGYINQVLKNSCPELENARDLFDRLLRAGACMLLIDHIDDVPDDDLREQLGQAMKQLCSGIYPNNVIVLAARDAGIYEAGLVPPSFSRVYLQAWNERQVESYINTWCRRLNPRKADALIEDVLQSVRIVNQYCSDAGMPPLIASPMMLGTLICLRLSATEWSPTRLSLLESIANLVLQSQCKEKTPADGIQWAGNWEKVSERLAHLAFNIHKEGSDNTAISLPNLRKQLIEQVPEDQINALIWALRVRGIIFYERSGLFEFYHRALQEFFTAHKIVRMRTEIFPKIEIEVINPWWREAMILAYALAQREKTPFSLEYLDWLANLNIAGLELAGAALIDYEPPRPDYRDTIIKRLVAALQDKTTGATPPQRANAGRALSRLGDPRFREDAWFLPNEELLGFVRISGGKYLIGANPERDREASQKESPMHELAMFGYYIARYPVTIGQYRAFVKESGYQPIDPNCLYGLSNMPVVNVTWDDTIVYARWMHRRLATWDQTPEELKEKLNTEDWHLTLCSEAEWECAAHGPRSRPYPWGNNFDPRLANTEEASIGATSPVGIFPGGESPFHILDMSGNVWEWTRNVYRIYYFRSDDGREDYESRDFRVLRGGSFLNKRIYARCSYRNMYYPDFKGANIGFRIGIHQSHDYAEKEIDMEVPVGEVADPVLIKTADANGMVKIKRKVMLRYPIVIEGPRQDR